MPSTLRSIKNRLHGMQQNAFLMNALYLMLSTFVVAAFGFVFWILVTRDYTAATVGLTATLLSVSGLLSMLGLAGFDITFVRFLPKSTRQNDQMNSGFVLVALTSIALSTGFVLSLPITSPRLAFVLHNPWYFASFVFFTTAASLTLLANAAFLAFKRARNIFVINIVFSVLKAALPLFTAHGSVMMIFTLVGTAQLVALIVSIVVMKAQLRYTFAPRIHLDILRITRKYSLSVYASSILNLLPPTVLPLIIVHQLGPEKVAYYYMAFTIASALYTISYASMQSAFVEGAHDEARMRQHIIKATRLVALLLVPIALIITGLSGFILRIFGTEYALNGSAILRLFAIGALPVTVYAAMGAIFKVTQNLRGVVLTNIVYAVVILAFSYILIPHLGVVAVGWAWMIGNIAAATTGLFLLRKSQFTIRRYT